jgi:hypothetical protein
MFKFAIALVLLAHGIGHGMGLLQFFKIASVNRQWNGESRLLTGTVGTTGIQVIGTAIWVAAIIGFAALAAAVMGWIPVEWFRKFAIGSVVVSLAGLLLFPVAFPVFSTIGALVVDLAVLAATIWYGWLPEGSGA